MEEEFRKNEERSTVSTHENTNDVTKRRIDDGAEYVPLASEGIYYKDQFKGMDKLLVRKIAWEDEDILTTKSYYDNGTLFNKILENTIVDTNGFSYRQLVPADRDSILYWLRMTAFGGEYKVPIKCENEKCGKTTYHTWNISEFEKPDIPEKYKEELKEKGSITITLPMSNAKCDITVKSIGKQDEIEKFLKKRKEREKSSRDYLITLQLLSSIDKVYDESGTESRTIGDILKWMNTNNNGSKMSIVDSRYILKMSKEIRMNIETKKKIVCKHCEHETEMSMPMTIYFFYPEFEELS